MEEEPAAQGPSVGIGPQARTYLLLTSPEALAKALAGQWESVRLPIVSPNHSPTGMLKET